MPDEFTLFEFCCFVEDFFTSVIYHKFFLKIEN